jgi:D-tyrosyl-tRNA(Tyr) deacylase
MDRSLAERGGGVLIVSQFTLYGDTSRGRRPSWTAAAPGALAEPLVAAVAEALRGHGAEVATGRFGADMRVDLACDGPVTVLLEVPPAAPT